MTALSAEGLAWPDAAPDASARSTDVLASLPCAVLVFEADGRVSYANPAAQQFLGMSASLLASRGLDPSFGGFDRLLALVAQARRHGRLILEHGMALALRKNAESLVVDARAGPLDGLPETIVATLTERTIESRLMSQFYQRDAGRAAANLARTLAHELRNPLSGIRGAAQLLGRNADGDDAALAAMICDEVDRIGGLVERIEAVGATAPLPRVAVNVHEVLDHVCLVAQNGFGRDLAIQRDYDPSLPVVDGDRDALVQLFLNLVKNAAEAAPPQGGRITLSTAYHYGLSVPGQGGTGRTQLPIAVSISDNGPGIATADMPHLFEPFFTTKHGGSGLGLAMVSKIVSDHGGATEVDVADGWTTFRVLLPRGTRPS